MSQYGYTYGAPPPSQGYSYQPSQVYATPQYRPDAIQPQNVDHGNSTQESYEMNRRAIPGLELNFPSNGAGWQQCWPNTPPGIAPISQLSLVPQSVTQINSTTTVANEPESKRPSTSGGSEEGELSEGELEDIYEPREPQGLSQIQSGVPAGTGHHMDRHAIPNLHSFRPNVAPVEGGWEGAYNTRDRSGSYSPHLSPREIQSNGIGTSGSGNVGTPAESQNVAMKVKNAPDINGGSKPLPSSRQQSVSEAREKARQAILRLWPLNIRYKNFVDEGIDKAILQDLFKELGLDPGMNSPTKHDIDVPTEPKEQVPETSTASTPTTAKAPELPANASGQAKSKSEERKDRIARLLAAKETKAAASAQENATPKPPTPTISAPAPKKAQSEKSKILQQKMEALKKAREAATKNESQKQDSAATSDVISSHTPTITESPLITSTTDVVKQKDPAVSNTSPAAVPAERSDPQATPSIPGLFLSSTPQPAPKGPSQRKRPVAADLNEAPTNETYKRPFGQTRESRPFLIDVSDDENDAEMDLDSPELRPSSIHRPITPSIRTSSFREHAPLPDKPASRQYSSPGQVSTPPIATPSSSGKFDLQSMNKKIEDMKRKIAEAEARKKAKISSNDSPSLPPSQVQSKEGSVEPSAIMTPPVSAPPTAPAMENLPKVVSPSLQKFSELKRQGSKGLSPARHRAASEKLPILEAHRKEQLLKLQQLQSEVARVEKEIQESLQEEERLKGDVEMATDNDESDAQPEDTAAQAPVISNASSSPDQTVEAEQEDTNALPSSEHMSPARFESSSETGKASNEHIDNEHGNTVQAAVDNGAAKSEDEASAHNSGDPDQDVDMEADGSSSEGDTPDESDNYEPPEAVDETSGSPSSGSSQSFSPAPADNAVLEASDTDTNGVATTSPVTQPISTYDRDSTSESDREVAPVEDKLVVASTGPSVPSYESPLQYFRAYRFHPKFNDTVAGGLRSLTYSNKIDVKKEMCPDELTGGGCPRGEQCQFQHMDKVQAPDDQILVQLGAYGDYEGDQKQQYIAGLRELLADYRKRGIKDFGSISQGIINYRAQFHGDKTKILPLGTVKI